MKTEDEYFMHDCHREQSFIDRDRRIIEFFSCWHEEDKSKRKWDKLPTCIKCGETMVWGNPNLSSPNGYFWLLDHIKESELIWNFMDFYDDRQPPFPTPNIFADVMDAFLTDIQGDQIGKEP